MTCLNQDDFNSCDNDDKNEEFKLLNTLIEGAKSFRFGHPATF